MKQENSASSNFYSLLGSGGGCIALVIVFCITQLPPFGGIKGGCQNIAINTTGTAADASAMLDVSGTNKGILIPRVALASATTTVTIASPATGLLVYNDGTGGLTPAGYYYNSGTTAAPVWVQVLKGPPWFITGNAGTTAANFIGTTDGVSLRFRTNNTEKMTIDTAGNVGIGTTVPNNALTVKPGSISIGSDAFAIASGQSNLMIAGPLGGATQGGGVFDAADQTWLTATNTYCAYIQNGMRMDGDVWMESGKIGIGTVSPGGLLHAAANTAALGLTIHEQASADADAHDLTFRKGRGGNWYMTPDRTNGLDELGVIGFRGYSGAGGYVTGSAIKSIADGSVISTSMPAHLSFWTGTNVAPTVLEERMRITSGAAGSSVFVDILAADLVNQTSICPLVNPIPYYGCGAGDFGFNWTSTTAPVGTVPTAILVEVNIGWDCHANGTLIPGKLNGNPSFGTFSSVAMSPCSCTSPGPFRDNIYTYTPPIGEYLDGGVLNTFRMTRTTCMGQSKNSTWAAGGAAGQSIYARVTVTYAPSAGFGGGGNVGIASTYPASTLTVGGSIAGKYRAGNTITMANTDMIINLNAAGGSTLPAANSVAAGTMAVVRNTTASAITLSRAGADTMCNSGVACGSTSVSVAANNVVRYVSDGMSVWIGW